MTCPSMLPMGLKVCCCTGDLITGIQSQSMEIKVCVAALILKNSYGELIAKIESSVILQLGSRAANVHWDCMDIHQ